MSISASMRTIHAQRCTIYEARIRQGPAANKFRNVNCLSRAKLHGEPDAARIREGPAAPQGLQASKHRPSLGGRERGERGLGEREGREEREGGDRGEGEEREGPANAARITEAHAGHAGGGDRQQHMAMTLRATWRRTQDMPAARAARRRDPSPRPVATVRAAHATGATDRVASATTQRGGRCRGLTHNQSRHTQSGRCDYIRHTQSGRCDHILGAPGDRGGDRGCTRHTATMHLRDGWGWGRGKGLY